MTLWERIGYKKPIAQLLGEANDDERLHRVLGPIGLTGLGVGAIIGAGIFVTTGKAAQVDAGPAIVIAYLVAGLACVLAALCYAEFASAVPVAGSAYTYSFATLGELAAWIIGWDLLLEYAMSCATVASAWSHYLEVFLMAIFVPDPTAAGAPQWIIPPLFQHDPRSPVTIGVGAQAVQYQSLFNLPAVCILALLTWVLVRGIKESVATNTVLVVLKVAVVLFVIFAGLAYVDPNHWTGIPFNTENLHKPDPEKWGLLAEFGLHEYLLNWDNANRSNFTPFGYSGIMVAAASVFFAYIGFDSISTHAEEAKNPGRDVPFGILASLALCTVLYIAVSLVITGMVPYPQIDVGAPIAKAFHDKAVETGSSYLRWATILVAGGGLAGMTSVLLVTFLSQSRVFMAMARDGLLPRWFGEVHPVYKTPHIGTLITGGVTCLAAAFTPIHELENMVNIGTLSAFTVVCAAVLLLRIRHPEVHRPFRCPWVYVIAPAGIFVNVTLMLFLPLHSWIRLGVWLIVGLILYFAGVQVRNHPKSLIWVALVVAGLGVVTFLTMWVRSDVREWLQVALGTAAAMAGWTVAFRTPGTDPAWRKPVLYGGAAAALGLFAAGWALHVGPVIDVAVLLCGATCGLAVGFPSKLLELDPVPAPKTPAPVAAE